MLSDEVANVNVFIEATYELNEINATNETGEKRVTNVTRSPLPTCDRGLVTFFIPPTVKTVGYSLASCDEVQSRASAEPTELLLVHGVLELDGL